MKSDILLRALELANQGISVVPVATDGSKRPGIPSWKEYQQRRPNTEELMRWFSDAGLARNTGQITGHANHVRNLARRAVRLGGIDQLSDELLGHEVTAEGVVELDLTLLGDLDVVSL